MRRSVVVALLILLSASVARAQFDAGPIVDLRSLSVFFTDTNTTYEFIEANPARLGREVLAVTKYPFTDSLSGIRGWVGQFNVFTPNHPTKSGYSGMYQTPGICIDRPIFTGFWTEYSVADIDGNGLDDLLLTSPVPVTGSFPAASTLQPFFGRGLVACR